MYQKERNWGTTTWREMFSSENGASDIREKTTEISA